MAPKPPNVRNAPAVPGEMPELALVREWLDGWRGVGLMVAGMGRQDFDLELRGFPRGWRATFYASGLAHSIVAGTGWAPGPAHAIQQAAWHALTTPRVARGATAPHAGEDSRGASSPSARGSRPRRVRRGARRAGG